MTPSDVAISRPTVKERVAALDTTVFEHIDTQTTDDDRTSLLAIHDAQVEPYLVPLSGRCQRTGDAPTATSHRLCTVGRSSRRRRRLGTILGR